MQKYTYIESSEVKWTAYPVEGFIIEQCFEPTVVALMKPCPDEVVSGWAYNDGKFIAPAEPVASFDEYKAALHLELRQKRLEAEYGGFEFLGGCGPQQKKTSCVSTP